MLQYIPSALHNPGQHDRIVVFRNLNLRDAMWVTLSHRGNEMKLPVVNAAAVLTTQRMTGQLALSSLDPICNWMCGKLDTIGAGRIPFVPEEDDKTAMSAIKIRGTLFNNNRFVDAAAVGALATCAVTLLLWDVAVAAIIAIASVIAHCLSAALKPAYRKWLGSLFFLLACRARDFLSHAW